jgi:hypothetical protein
MENDNKSKPKKINEPEIKKEKGLTIEYNKTDFSEKFPNIIDEINGKKKIVKIESIKQSLEDNIGTNHPRELINPGAIDFIRRCRTINEAFSILDYLLEREEISKSEYSSFKTQIQQEKSLRSFINKHGGFKSPGYYEKRYRNMEKLNKNIKEE